MNPIEELAKEVMLYFPLTADNIIISLAVAQALSSGSLDKELKAVLALRGLEVVSSKELEGLREHCIGCDDFVPDPTPSKECPFGVLEKNTSSVCHLCENEECSK